MEKRETCSPRLNIFYARPNFNRSLYDDVTAAILVLQNNAIEAMLAYQASHVGVEHFS